MSKIKLPCPRPGTLDTITNSHDKMNLIYILLESEANDRFAKEFKDLFHPTSALNTAMTTMENYKIEFEYLNEIFPDFLQVMTILNNAAKDGKIHLWQKSISKKKVLLSIIDRFTTISNTLKVFTKKNFNHCKKTK